MKSLFFVSILTLSTIGFCNTGVKLQSEVQLKACFSKAYQRATQSTLSSKDTTKQVSQDVKECRQYAANIKKEERAQKKLASNAKRIAKLKEQLAKLSAK